MALTRKLQLGRFSIMCAVDLAVPLLLHVAVRYHGLVPYLRIEH
jgi:hypothetical protein